MEDFAAELCETMSRSTGSVCAVTDRDTIIAVAGGSKRELLGKRITPELEEIMEGRKIYQYGGGEDGPSRSPRGWTPLTAAVAAPHSGRGRPAGTGSLYQHRSRAVTGEAEFKLAQTIAAFFGPSYGKLTPDRRRSGAGPFSVVMFFDPRAHTLFYRRTGPPFTRFRPDNIRRAAVRA